MKKQKTSPTKTKTMKTNSMKTKTMKTNSMKTKTMKTKRMKTKRMKTKRLKTSYSNQLRKSKVIGASEDEFFAGYIYAKQRIDAMRKKGPRFRPSRYPFVMSLGTPYEYIDRHGNPVKENMSHEQKEFARGYAKGLKDLEG